MRTLSLSVCLLAFLTHTSLSRAYIRLPSFIRRFHTLAIFLLPIHVSSLPPLHLTHFFTSQPSTAPIMSASESAAQRVLRQPELIGAILYQLAIPLLCTIRGPVRWGYRNCRTVLQCALASEQPGPGSAENMDADSSSIGELDVVLRGRQAALGEPRPDEGPRRTRGASRRQIAESSM